MLRHGSAFHLGTTVASIGHNLNAMRTVDAQATRDALPFARLVPALQRAFSEGCEVPPRQAHVVGAIDGDTCTSLIMPAWSRSGSAAPHYGVKIVNIAPGNAAQGLAGLHASYLLFDALTGVPLACIDGSVLTTRRTAAASALAASFLARGDARRLLVVGAGAVARVLPEAYRAVRPIERVTVWARAPHKAAALAEALRADGFDALAHNDLAEAVKQADIVSCATLATEPLLQGRWLAPGSHLDLIGSFTPQMREADDDCFAGACLFIDTDEALRKSGDLLGPLARGVIDAGTIQGTLADLCTGRLPGRQGALQRTVFKSVGTALEDLAAAMLVLDTAKQP
jgi:ornithine cyclodeaminase